MVAASEDNFFVNDGSVPSHSSTSDVAPPVDTFGNSNGELAAAVSVPRAVAPAGRGQSSGRSAGIVTGGTGGHGVGRSAGAGRGAGHGEGHGGRERGRGRGKGGCPIGHTNYSPTEIMNMLDSIRDYLPISGLEWDPVAQCHMAFHPDKERSSDQLKKKFNKLSKVKMGTGDPNMPPDIREAKEIRRLIIEKSEGVTVSEDEMFALDKLDEEDAKSSYDNFIRKS